MKTGELVHHLRVLDCEQCYLCRECKGPHKLKCFLFGEAADTLEAQQKRIKELEAGHRWIPVTERLPDEHKSVVPGLGTVSNPVLVTWVDPFSKNAYPDNSFVREGITRNGEFTLKHINGDLVPVAWMPQPKPYKPPQEGENHE